MLRKATGKKQAIAAAVHCFHSFPCAESLLFVLLRTSSEKNRPVRLGWKIPPKMSGTMLFYIFQQSYGRSDAANLNCKADSILAAGKYRISVKSKLHDLKIM